MLIGLVSRRRIKFIIRALVYDLWRNWNFTSMGISLLLVYKSCLTSNATQFLNIFLNIFHFKKLFIVPTNQKVCIKIFTGKRHPTIGHVLISKQNEGHCFTWKWTMPLMPRCIHWPYSNIGQSERRELIHYPLHLTQYVHHLPCHIFLMYGTWNNGKNG